MTIDEIKPGQWYKRLYEDGEEDRYILVDKITSKDECVDLKYEYYFIVKDDSVDEIENGNCTARIYCCNPIEAQIDHVDDLFYKEILPKIEGNLDVLLKMISLKFRKCNPNVRKTFCKLLSKILFKTHKL